MAFFLHLLLRVMQIKVALLAIYVYLEFINSEQAGRPRSSRPRRMKMGMIREVNRTWRKPTVLKAFLSGLALKNSGQNLGR